jgi:hypothetical protein
MQRLFNQIKNARKFKNLALTRNMGGKHLSKNDPFMRFDWYFTDASKRDAARFHALQAKKVETFVLMDLASADSLVHFALWSELPKNHPVGELWLETQTDLLASVYLAYGGFFRQALSILRCWFEIAVHGVYFSAYYGQKNSRYEQWRRGVRKAPRMEHVAESLASRKMVLKVEEAVILKKSNRSIRFCRNIPTVKDLTNINYKRDVITFQDFFPGAMMFGTIRFLKHLIRFLFCTEFSFHTKLHHISEDRKQSCTVYAN